MGNSLFGTDDFKPTGVENFDCSLLSEDARVTLDQLGVPNRTKKTLVGRLAGSNEKARVKFATMNLYPDNKEKNPGAPAACYQNDILGVGWGGAGEKKNHAELSTAEQTQLVFDRYGENGTKAENDFAYFALWLSPGDIVITKNIGPVAKYARVKGPIKHRNQSNVESELKKHSIGFYREVEWVDVSPKDAPAKILSTTCRGTLTLPNLDRVSMEQIVDQFHSPIGEVDHVIENINISDIFAELKDKSVSDKSNSNRLINSLSASGSYNGLETVVCTYVQNETGAVMHPSSRSYPGIEALFRNSGDDEPETYGVQVKRGSFDNKDELRQFAENHDALFLFSSSGDEIEHDSIKNIDQSELSEYIIEFPHDLPPVEVDRILRTHRYLLQSNEVEP